MNTPDMRKVREALSKYDAPVHKPKIQEKLPPVDSALRKPLRGPSRSCTGFNHPHFLNNGLQ